MACAVAVPPPPAAMETPAVPVIRALPGVPSSTNARTTPAPMSRPPARCLPKFSTTSPLSLDLGPVRADDGHKGPRRGPDSAGQRPEVPRRLVEAGGASGQGEVELLRRHGAADLRLADPSIYVELRCKSAVRREERAEDMAGGGPPARGVARGGSGGEGSCGGRAGPAGGGRGAPRAGGGGRRRR